MTPTRLVLAPVLVAAVLGLFYLDHATGECWGTLGLAGFFGIACVHEFCAMARLKGRNPDEAAALIFTLGWLAATWWTEREGGRLPIPGALGTGGALLTGLAAYLGLRMVLTPGRRTVEDAAIAGAGTAYIGGLLTLLLWIRFRPESGEGWLVWLFAVSKATDSAAYLAGKSFGRLKMAPLVSPNKTWEGAIGGLAGGGALGFFLLPALVGDGAGTGEPWARAGLCAATSAASQAGDLVESAYKRWAGAKDSGRILPEFGGGLDMIDGVLWAGAVVAGWLTLGA